MTRRALLAAALLACVPDRGPLMLPGSDCLECHRGGNGAARRWTVAGTIYATRDAAADEGVSQASVRITDATGWSFTLRTNGAGNFYTAEPVAFPLRACVERGADVACMGSAAERGSCNHCHGPQGVGLEPPGHASLFPIDAASKHAAARCGQCHADLARPAVATLFQCPSCHLGLDPDLASRHTTTTRSPGIVVVDYVAAGESCLRCHADAQVHRTSNHPSGAQGTPPHHEAGCTTCHDTFRADKPFGADFATNPASWPAGSGHGCTSCHTSGVGEN